jgi:hypothetical protein
VIRALGTPGNVIRVPGTPGDVIRALGTPGDVIRTLGTPGDVIRALGTPWGCDTGPWVKALQQATASSCCSKLQHASNAMLEKPNVEYLESS